MWTAAIAVVLSCISVKPTFANCRDDTVYLRGDWGQARFSVEIADSFEEQRIGLMNRPTMPSASGMLFLYETPRQLTFWMRNTLIELDLLFVDSKGVVQIIHHSAQPHDETPIRGGIGVAVLEINGGMSESMGISVGTELRHPSFQKGDPAWSC